MVRRAPKEEESFVVTTQEPNKGVYDIQFYVRNHPNPSISNTGPPTPISNLFGEAAERGERGTSN